MGDLLVTVNVQVPKNIEGEAREALEAFRRRPPATTRGLTCYAARAG